LLFELMEFFFLILPNYLPPANRYNNSHQSHANEDLNMYSNVLDIIKHFIPAANHYAFVQSWWEKKPLTLLQQHLASKQTKLHRKQANNIGKQTDMGDLVVDVVRPVCTYESSVSRHCRRSITFSILSANETSTHRPSCCEPNT
jgi:hypothetical protein